MGLGTIFGFHWLAEEWRELAARWNKRATEEELRIRKRIAEGNHAIGLERPGTPLTDERARALADWRAGRAVNFEDSDVVELREALLAKPAAWTTQAKHPNGEAKHKGKPSQCAEFWANIQPKLDRIERAREAYRRVMDEDDGAPNDIQ
jgi:hypothetical protein